VPRILESPGYKDDGLLVVSFNEAENDNSACCNERAANTPNAAGPTPGPGGGKVGAVLISPFIRPGTVDDTPYNHYGFLRTVEDLDRQTYEPRPRAVRDRRRPPGDDRVGGVCRATGARLTSDEGKRTITVRYARRGSCRIAASRPAWQTAVKSFKLRSPKRR
jgi:Phosphoesterase family